MSDVQETAMIVLEAWHRKMGFPTHWRGLTPGQSSEERAAVIIENIAADKRAKGDHSGAAEVLAAYRTAGQSRVTMSPQAALAKALSLAVDLPRT